MKLARKIIMTTKLVSAFILCAIVSCKAQHSYTVKLPANPKVYLVVPDTSTAVGDIFNVPLTSGNSSQFSRTGSSGTWTYSTSLSISGTGVDAPGNFIQYANWTTNLEDCVMQTTFTPSADGYGIGVGPSFQISGANWGFYAKIILTGATKGQLRYDNYQNGTVTNLANSGTTYFNIVNGNQYNLSLIRTPDTITVKIQNTSTLDSQLLKYPVQYSYGNWYGHRASKVSLYWFGGSQNISSIKYSTGLLRNPKMLFLGDSYMEGAFAGTESDRYFRKCQLYFSDRLMVDAGASNTSGDCVNLMPEVLLFNPKSVFLDIGTNGITQANVDTIRDQLTRRNIPLYLGTDFPNVSSLRTSQNAIIRGTTGVTLIDFDPTLINGGTNLYPGYAAPDNTHLNTAGNNAVYLKLVSSLTGFLTPR